MSDFDGVFTWISTGDISGNYRGVTYDSIKEPRFVSPDERSRVSRETGYFANGYLAEQSGWVPASTFPGIFPRPESAVVSGQYRGTVYDAVWYNPPGMYTERDRIPRIGVHQSLTGYGIPNVDVLITGKLGITSTARTDDRGIWYAYLPVDDYSDADIRSFGNGYIYQLMEQKERPEGYIWDEVMKRVTPPTSGFRMIYRFT
jgi:hypothetical protein